MTLIAYGQSLNLPARRRLLAAAAKAAEVQLAAWAEFKKRGTGKHAGSPVNDFAISL